MTFIIAIAAFLASWVLTLDWGALIEFLLMLCAGWLIIQLTCKCKRENRIDALKIYTLLMLCYGAYAFLCHAYRIYNNFEAIGSMDGPGYYLPCTMELFDSESLGELIRRIGERDRYNGGGTIFIYFVGIARLALNHLHVDLHLAIQLSLMPFAALICVVEYHLLKCFDLPASSAYKWSIGFGLFSALFGLSSFIVRDLPITLAYFLITYLIFSPAPRWQRVLWLGGVGTIIAGSIRFASGVGMIPLLLLAVFCDPKKGTIKYWQLGLCVAVVIFMGWMEFVVDELAKVSQTYLDIELQDQGGQSLLSSFNALPFGISHIVKTVYAQFHPVPAWRNMFATAATGFRDYAYNITKFPDIWVVFFRITGIVVLFYGCLKSEIRRKVFENKPLLYGFIYIVIWMTLQASTIEERRKLGGYAILFTVAVLFWREMPRVSRIRALLLSFTLFMLVQLTYLLKTVL
jgi:hypothetical protein